MDSKTQNTSPFSLTGGDTASPGGRPAPPTGVVLCTNGPGGTTPKRRVGHGGDPYSRVHSPLPSALGNYSTSTGGTLVSSDSISRFDADQVVSRTELPDLGGRPEFSVIPVKFADEENGSRHPRFFYPHGTEDLRAVVEHRAIDNQSGSTNQKPYMTQAPRQWPRDEGGSRGRPRLQTTPHMGQFPVVGPSGINPSPDLRIPVFVGHRQQNCTQLPLRRDIIVDCSQAAHLLGAGVCCRFIRSPVRKWSSGNANPLTTLEDKSSLMGTRTQAAGRCHPSVLVSSDGSTISDDQDSGEDMMAKGSQVAIRGSLYLTNGTNETREIKETNDHRKGRREGILRQRYNKGGPLGGDPNIPPCGIVLENLIRMTVMDFARLAIQSSVEVVGKHDFCKHRFHPNNGNCGYDPYDLPPGPMPMCSPSSPAPRTPHLFNGFGVAGCPT